MLKPFQYFRSCGKTLSFQANFEIGVWDPELAKGLEDCCLDKVKRDEFKGFEDLDVSLLGVKVILCHT